MGDGGQPKRGNPNWRPGRVPSGATPFGTGISGNPRGASRRARLAHLLQEQLAEIVESDPKKRTAGQLLVRALVKEAMKGNVRAAEICLDRVDGKLPQGIAHMTPEEAAETLSEMLGVEPEELLGSARQEGEE